jgi:hypothetical protein
MGVPLIQENTFVKTYRKLGQVQWLMSIILATQEVEIGRIMV